MAESDVIILSRGSQQEFIASWFELAQDTHFWMRGRLAALLKQLNAHHLPWDRPLTGLEIGCGHGVLRHQIEQNTPWTIDGVDLDLDSLKSNPPCRGKPYLYNIFDKKESFKERYDFILLYDVIEHIEDVQAFMEASLFHLKPSGLVFINVPALNSLYSNYDKFVGHLRRYDTAMMLDTLKASGLTTICCHYWGYCFLPLLMLRRRALAKDDQLEPIVQKGFNPQNKIFNALLTLMISSEIALFPFPPKGTSVMAIARKPGPEGLPS